MGAQAAALLAAGGPVGDVPTATSYDGSLRLAADVDLARTALTHGGVGLRPTAWDGARLHLRLPDPVVIEADLTVRWRGTRPAEAVLRRVLAADDDLEPLRAACDRVPELAWVRSTGAGRVLRSPTVWQDLVGTLAGTRTSYAGSRAMLRQLVGDGPFPTPGQVLDRDLGSWGHRAEPLRALAREVEGGWDPESLWDLPDGAVLARVRALRGFGPFAAAQLMPLLGRPRPPVPDGWLSAQAGDPARFAPMGEWAGTGAWLSVVGTWLAVRSFVARAG